MDKGLNPVSLDLKIPPVALVLTEAFRFAGVRYQVKDIDRGPGSSGSRPMPEGRTQEPGGWNRIALEVDDLQARVSELKKAGMAFRNAVESGPGGQQIQLEDPDGNPIELLQPAQ